MERFIDLTSDDEELSSDPKVLPIVDTEIQSDSFVDLISDDEEIFQYPSPSTSSLGDSNFNFYSLLRLKCLFSNCFVLQCHL